MKTLITGATGFIGTALLRRLRHPRLLLRRPDAYRAGAEEGEAVAWDAMQDEPPPSAFAGVDTVVLLAGESLAGARWSDEHKKRMRESRIAGTRKIVAAMAKLDRAPPNLIAASAIGYYGSRGGEVLPETAAPGSGYLADLCRDWEAAAREAERCGSRVVLLRLGVVLGRGGGALARMLPVFRWGLGGPLGDGSQWFSWIHVDDLIEVILFAARDSAVRGAVNAVAPEPVTNRQFTRALARAMHRPAFFRVPRVALRAVLGEMADAALLASARVVPAVLTERGFRFQYPRIEEALAAALARGPASCGNAGPDRG
ncbi:MAG: TIGR01777 family oxidoreductase [Planctomycetes bacterium]|nr:TIGR01777 family oxidoreductase [Planctomycetota bacterium]